MKTTTFLNALFVFLLSIFSVTSPLVNAALPPENNLFNEQTFAIKNVNIHTMVKGKEALINTNIVIKNKKIVSIAEPIPDNILVIDGRGKWLIPGLIDMHVHGVADFNFGEDELNRETNLFFDTQDVMTPYIANGVTTIFDLDARPENFAQRNEIKKGNVIGPRIALAKFIDGGEGINKVNSPVEGRLAVRLAKFDGYGFIKVYSFLNIATYEAIIDEAQQLGMKVVGHIPISFKTRINDAFIPHFGMIAHAEELARWAKENTDEEALRLATLVKNNNTWVTPTLTVMDWITKQARTLDDIKQLSSLKYLHPIFQDKWINNNSYQSSPEFIAHVDRIADFNKKLVRALKSLDVPIVVGTDAMVSGVMPGFSVHDELKLLVEAGLTPKEALNSATNLAAQWLGTHKTSGTIEVNKIADLILLNSNPFIDISNTTDIYGVAVNGRWLSDKIIDSMLKNLAAKNKQSQGKYEWGKRAAY